MINQFNFTNEILEAAKLLKEEQDLIGSTEAVAEGAAKLSAQGAAKLTA